MKTFAVLLLFAIAGCATGAPVTSVTSIAPSVYCLPNGVSQSVLMLPIVYVGNFQGIMFVRYEKKGQDIVIGWFGGVPAMYDSKPDDKDSSLLKNAQVFPLGNSAEIRKPSGPCKWYSTDDINT